MTAQLPYPSPSSPAASAIAQGNRPRDTLPEVRIRSMLHRAGYRFRKDLLVHVPGRRRGIRPDIAFPRRKVAIFVDGCFWHGCSDHGHVPVANATYWRPKLERNVARDRLVDEGLRATGWKVVRIWEHVPPAEAAEKVMRILDDRSWTGNLIAYHLQR